jgi:signal transduction histidine kinase
VANRPAETLGPADLLTLNRAATVARLLAGMAHELNNAMLVMGGTAELMQATPELPASIAAGLERITAQNARAAKAIREVMVFARQDADSARRVNLREIADKSVSLRAYAIGRARLSIAVEASPTGRFLVNGNPALLQLAVINLVVNAEQALAGQRDGAIRVELEERGGSVVLRVSDNGPGVDHAIARDVFEPFFTTRSREEASGLGLPVARQIVEEHGGTLTLKDHRAPGACFEMRLPAA